MIELPAPIKYAQRRWTKDEIDFLKNNYTSLKGAAEQIGNKLGRGKYSVHKKARILGLTDKKYCNRSSKNWNDEEINFLQGNYSNMSTIEIAKKLGRTEQSIVSQAFNLGFAPIKGLNKLSKKGRKLKDKYNLSEYNYYRQVELYNNKCEICGERETKIHGQTKRVQELAVDHDHTTNKIRGLLCHRCNLIVIGALRSPKILKSAVRYLEKDGVL